MYALQLILKYKVVISMSLCRIVEANKSIFKLVILQL